MNEQEWLTSDDPATMLEFLKTCERLPGPLPISDRKLRLFAETANPSMANGPTPYLAAWGAAGGPIGPNLDKANLLREICGNPWRPVKVGHVVKAARDMSSAALESGASEEWIRPHWLTPTIQRLAEAVYESFGTERGLCSNHCDRGWIHTSGGSSEVCKSCGGSGTGTVCPECRGSGVKDAGYMHTHANIGGDQFYDLDCPACHGTGKVAGYDTYTMLILGDTLEEAGAPEEILRHVRGMERCLNQCSIWSDHPQSARIYDDEHGTKRICDKCKTGWIPLRSPHVKGCWAIDTILGK